MFFLIHFILTPLFPDDMNFKERERDEGLKFDL